MKFDLQFSDIPHNWAICYLQDCPLASTCLRHRAATLAPATLRHHDCVLPAALSEESCALFVADQPARIAYGMTDILPGAKSWEVKSLRDAIMPIFGSRAQFYRYRAGDYPITPEQQEKVAAIFSSRGISKEPHYDRVEVTYYFPND